MSELPARPRASRASAIVLAGGLGTRLRSVVADRPKVLAEVSGRPFLAYVLDQLAAAGVPRAVVSTGYLGALVREAIGERHRGMEVAWSHETTPLGTGGAMRLALDLAEGNPLLALNGDSLCVVDFEALLTRHERAGAAATLTLTRVEDASRYGTVTTGDDGAVVRFEEKRPGGGPAWINAGVYALSRALLEGIPEGRAVSLERDVLPGWVGRGLVGFQGGGAFLDIGVPEDHARAAGFVARLP